MYPPAAIQKLSSRSTYILPTGYGIFFAIVFYTMLMGSMNYSNSMGFMLTFLLAGMALVGMLYTYRNLTSLRLIAGHPKPVFAGDKVEFPVYLQTSNARPAFRIAGGPHRKDLHTVDVTGAGTCKLNIKILATRRGWLELDPIRVQTTFPLGWFRVWSWVALETKALVYPQPHGHLRLPPNAAAGIGRKQTQTSGNDDFSGVRRYQPSDPPAHIAWKALAKGHEVLTKQFSEQSGEELWLDWNSLPGLDTEQRLSQLCLWVLNLHQQGRLYGLRLPGVEIKPNVGEQQRKACLEALALYR
ncbi:MAG: DUF58 domain-containing protein [Gammaproteobacteria bacterium]|nr:DUF58 domain-containing protein [Gammaproteobacteria bacterium]